MGFGMRRDGTLDARGFDRARTFSSTSMCDAALTQMTSRRSSLNTSAELSLSTLLHLSHWRTMRGRPPAPLVGVPWCDIGTRRDERGEGG